jgi:hypothetical protein
LVPAAALAALLLVASAAAAPAASAITCNTATATPTTGDPGSVVLADNFETGSFSRWTTVVRNGDASAYVTGTHHVSGWCGGRLHVTSNSGSRAYIQKSFGWQARDVWATGQFYIDGGGWVPNNVPYLRLWNGGRRILDVYRQNGAGALWLRAATSDGSWSYVKLKSWVSLDAWHSLKIHASPAWSSSTVEVWFDGVRVYSNGNKYLPTDNLTSVMIGAEHYRQQMDLYFDDVVIKAR